MSSPSKQPHTRPISEALGSSHLLGRLLERLRDSETRMTVVRSVLPPALRAHVRPGVLDDEGWNLLAPNGAVAAKLRQCLPLIEQVLMEQGWPPTTIRIKVLPGPA